MIIDAHHHLNGGFDWRPDAFNQGFARAISTNLKRLTGQDFDIDFVRENIQPSFIDTNGDKIVERMDEAGVDKTVIFDVDYDYGMGAPKVSFEKRIEFYVDAVKRHPGRLLALFAIDPRRPGAVEMTEKAIKEHGMIGIKIHPSTGFKSNDKECLPMYELAAKLNVPIMFHAGGTPASPGWESSRPVWIAEAAFGFPNVKMIIAHLGGDWWNEAVMACKMLANVYVDLSTWQLLYKRDAQQFYEWLRNLIGEVGVDRILWGTDGPTLHSIVPLNDWAKAFTEPPKDIQFTPDEIDAMMYKNSQQVYGIE